MLQLPNGCSCSQPTIYPRNWNRATASVKKNWYIQYYFHDPNHKDQFPRGKFCQVKGGVNVYKTPDERRAAIKIVLDQLMVSLTINGYNPILDKFIAPVEYTGDITKGTGFVDALNAAKKNIKVGKYSTRDLADVIKGVEQAARRLHLANIPISMITRKYIRIILNECGTTAHKFNKYRTYLMILFNEIIDAEATEQDSMARIKKRKLAAGFAHHGHIRGVSISEF